MDAVLWFGAVMVTVVALIGSVGWASEDGRRVLGWVCAALASVVVLIGLWLHYDA